MKKEYKILIGLAFGGAAFLIYSNWDKIKEKLGIDKKDAEPKKDDAKNQTGSGTNTNTSGGGYSYYQVRVMKLQELLGVAVDGVAGEQTNGKLEWYFCDYLCQFDAKKALASGYPSLKKNGKGVVSPSNVEFYITILSAKKSPRQTLNTYLDFEKFKKDLGL
jgi:hypothetical protein